MVDTDGLREAIPHYVAMLLVLFLVLGVIQRTAGETSFWVDIAVIVVVVFGYQVGGTRRGLAPGSWR